MTESSVPQTSARLGADSAGVQAAVEADKMVTKAEKKANSPAKKANSPEKKATAEGAAAAADKSSSRKGSESALAKADSSDSSSFSLQSAQKVAEFVPGKAWGDNSGGTFDFTLVACLLILGFLSICIQSQFWLDWDLV